MSSFNPEDNQSPQNITVPIESTTIPLNESGSTTQLRLNSQYQFKKLIAKLKIVNEDSVNSITFRLPSPSAPLRTVPPSSSTTVEEYTFFLELNFDIGNITSYLELDLVNNADAKQRTSDVGKGAA